MAQRSTRPRGCGVGRRHPRADTHRDVEIRLVAGHLEHRGRHREDAGVSGGHDGDVPSAPSQVQGEGGALRLDLVVRLVTDLPRPQGNSLDVGRVANEIRCGGQDSACLGGEPLGAGRPRADDGDRSERHRGADGGHGGGCSRHTARQHDHREVGHLGGVHVPRGQGPLAGHRRALDVDRVVEPTRPLQGVTDAAEGAAELHHDSRVGRRDRRCERVVRERAGDDGQQLGVLDERHARGRGRCGDRGDAGDDGGVVCRSQPLVQVLVGAVGEGVAEGQHGDGPPGVQVGREADAALLVEGGQLGVVVVAVLRRDGVDELLLDDALAQVGVGDLPSRRPAVPGGVVDDDVGALDRANRLERQQLRVAGPQADADQPTGGAGGAGGAGVTGGWEVGRHHSTSDAMALSAPQVMAEPPRRPCTTR